MTNREMAKELVAAAKDLAAATEYQEFFQKKLDEWEVKSPAELEDADKKKFFNEIEKEWTGEKKEASSRTDSKKKPL